MVWILLVDSLLERWQLNSRNTESSHMPCGATEDHKKGRSGQFHLHISFEEYLVCCDESLSCVVVLVFNIFDLFETVDFDCRVHFLPSLSESVPPSVTHPKRIFLTRLTETRE
jgi:hypothetical protein